MASRVHSRAGSRAPSNAPPPLVVDLGADQAPSREPIVMTLPTVERPPIYIDAPAPVVAPGLSGGRGMFKRLIVACDGTWLNSDNGMLNGRIACPSNVTRISRAIKAVSQDGIPQIVNYQLGVGSQGGIANRIVGGATGEGLGDTIREAYSFLANNYHHGDEIFLFGFSRGAFTARSIAGLISEIGLLTKKGLQALPEVFQDVQHRRDPKYVPKNPHVPFPNKPSASSPRYAAELERRGLSRLEIPIKVVGVWDTVGSLGTPRVGWLTRVGLQSQESKEMAFYDTKLSNCIENAFQALALDEKRSAFSPAVWEKPEGNKTTLRQVWFPGVHSNVGGGYDDQQLANITLAWMMSQCEPFLDMRDEYLLEQDDENARYYRRDRQDVRPWSFGEIQNSMTGIYALGGGTLRTPGMYHAVDPFSCRPIDRPLRQTNEYIHPSVRARIKLGGPGVADRGLYECRALTDNYKLVVDYGHGSTHPRSDDGPDIFWKLKWKEEGAARVLPEAPLWRLERELCKRDPKTWDYVRRPPGTGKEGRKSKKPRPVTGDFPPDEKRSSKRSPVENGDHGFALGENFVRSGVGSRRSFVDEKRERRSRTRAMSMDRETDIRENMPHRRAKDKTWWDGDDESETGGRRGSRRYRSPTPMRSPRRSTVGG